MSKPFYKHKLLFDQNTPPRRGYPRLNEHFDVKHVSHDYNKRGTPDEQVYKMACEQGRVIITINRDYFGKLVGTKDDCGVIAIPDGPAADRTARNFLRFSHAPRPQLFPGARSSPGRRRCKQTSGVDALAKPHLLSQNLYFFINFEMIY